MLLTVIVQASPGHQVVDPGVPRDMGGFDFARVELTGVPGIDLALDVLDGDGKRLMTINDGGPGEYEVIPNVGVDPGRTYYFRVREAGARLFVVSFSGDRCVSSAQRGRHFGTRIRPRENPLRFSATPPTGR